MSRTRSLALIALLGGCAYITDDDEKWRLDPDGDGAPIGEDCDDADPDVTSEVTWFADGDGDGFGAPGSESTGCAAPAASADNDLDCDDTDADVFPDAPDTWYDGVDSDCAGNDDDDADGDGYKVDVDCDDTDPSLAPDPSVTETWFNGVDDNCDNSDEDGDQDGDGWWAVDYAVRVADNGASPLPIPSGRAGDCWDDPASTPTEQEVVAGATPLVAADVNPGATETWYDGADQDCLGSDANGDGVADDFDQDADGHATADHADAAGAVGDDCLDTNADVHPGLTETWYDGVDADCDGADDYDADGDLYDSSSDCDDSDPAVHPDQVDFWYDGLDADCGGEDDYDADGDGDQSADWGGYDCDDTDPGISSLATETWYDGVDTDCSGGSDYDADADGYESDAYVAGGGDCDDANSAANPGMTEICENGFDDDCDGSGQACGVHGEQPLSGATASWEGEVAGDSLGYFMAGGADVSGDGVDDVAFAAPLASSAAGVVYVATAVPSGDVSAATAAARIQGDNSSNHLGYGLAMADLDADGVADLVMGAPRESVGAFRGGAVFVVSGPIASGTAGEAFTVADSVMYGTSSSGNAGFAIAEAGDQDGDSLTDVVIGAPGWSSDFGAVYLASGPTAGATRPLSRSVRLQATVYGRHGAQVDGGGDLDGDGQADLLIGAPYRTWGASSQAGAVFTVLGPVTADTTLAAVGTAMGGGTASGLMGEMLDLAGDLNGDGLDDAVVGAPYEPASGAAGSGLTYVVFGPATASGDISTLADITIAPGATADYCGRHVDGSGDLDGDGSPDLVLGCPYTSDRATYGGAAYVLYGPLTAGSLTTDDSGGSILGDQAYEYGGYAVQSAGDLDGDGTSDLLVASPGWDNGSANETGRVSFFPGGSW
jgi:hypothetical protein